MELQTLNRMEASSSGGSKEDKIRFSKFSAFGNTFIIVDESDYPIQDDDHRTQFARWALNEHFGIGGADNVLYLQALSPDEKDLWGGDYSFRVFEHDGAETLSCGNGLLSSAVLVHETTGLTDLVFLTELPSGKPKPVSVGIREDVGSAWIRLDWPTPTPVTLYRRLEPAPESGIDPIGPIKVAMPQDADWAEGLSSELELSGLLVYTGEPHLILISGRGLPAELEGRIWLDDLPTTPIGLSEPPAMSASKRLVHHIGTYVNKAYRELFPQGVHLNFTRISGDGGAVEYRTYERAIDRETLACGSGAIGIVWVLQYLGEASVAPVTLWPHRCRWYLPEASLTVETTNDGLVLTGWPRKVCQGAACYPSQLY